MHIPSVWQPALPTLFKITVLGSALATLGLAGCASTQSATSSKGQASSAYLEASNLDGLEDLLSATDMRAVEGDRLLILKHGDVWKRMTVGFKMNLDFQHPRIEAQRGWFISRQPYLNRLSARASRYLYHTVKEAERRGMPTELALLPVIESSYDPAATSSAAAAGLWQFIPSTGRIYGLEQNSGYDGRRDVVESTRAAYEFLGSLYNQFGSWELALAAYNAGPGRIQQAINRNKAAGLPTDYWSLKLPQETMNYVPRFLAVAQIIKNPNAYGVTLPPIANRPHFREVHVGAVALDDIATLTGLSRAELYQLNPGHRGEHIDARSPMRILIPADLSPTLDARLKQLSGGSASSILVAAKQATQTQAESKALVTKSSPPPVLTASKQTNLEKTQTAIVTKPTALTSTVTAKNDTRRPTPRGSSALAEFASQSEVPIPSAPRIPVAVTPVVSVKQIETEPEISVKARQELQAVIQADAQNVTVDEVLKPIATADERAEVIAELKNIAPVGTEIVDPSDGKIKLTAIQTSQSIAEQRGQEVTKAFAYPKGLAEGIPPDSVEAKMNQGKNVIKTETDVVVIQPKGQRSTYKVLPGDTLLMIAAKHGLNWRDVAKWNQIDPNATLYVGTSIYLYDAKPVAVAPKAASKPESYIVQPNDTLTGIANEFSLSLKDLADWNGLNTTSGVRIGQKLNLKPTVIEPKQSEKIHTTQSYTVKRGEYLKLIAERYGLSNAELASLTTGLTAHSELQIGQKINVPTESGLNQSVAAATPLKSTSSIKQPQVATETYIVKRGENLNSIAKQTNMTVAELAALNGLTSQSGLRIGQNIRIPAGRMVPNSYTVQAGDSLYSIATQYDLSIDHIAELNNLSRSAGLRVGQNLVLTAQENQPRVAEANTWNNIEIHEVKAGESLNSIARQYRLQLAYLAELNDIDPRSVLRVGQRLKVEGLPQTRSVEKTAGQSASSAVQRRATESYTVKSGESLHAIAGRFNISAAELAQLNQLKASAKLTLGQVLQVPKLFVDYTVRRGDTLIGLAKRHGIETAELAQLNDLTPNAQLRVGEQIKVPH